MAKIVIVGCSWGCGERGHDGVQPTLNHIGLEQYLSVDHSVINLSRPGASNWQIAYALRNYLFYKQNSNEELVIMILQTDAARRQCCDKFDVDHDAIMQQSKSLQEYYQRLLEIFYIKLNGIAEQFKVTIHMVGGLTDLDLETLSLYENLESCCQSWLKLLDTNHVADAMPLIFLPGMLEEAKKLDKLDLFEEIIFHSDKNFLQAQKMMETDFFGPVHGDFHPSRKGHEIMANYFKKYLQSLET
jgi:hypothetical protein